MTLSTGATVGVYEIVSLLGRGGMGEVYRARDTRLGRQVAIKVLPDVLAADAERTARFEREARVLASLNHPQIAALHGMEIVGDRHLLIMELVEGETLAERLARGALPAGDALRIGIQIAEALEAAHEQGVVHRDLKPANIKITPDDKVKVLDFGLAKAMGTAPVAVDVSQSPTLSPLATNAGVILGTAAYMSPEQAKGLAADHRSDIFSFGCVLYEMLTGKLAFPGDSVPEVMASILARQPDLTALSDHLNPRLIELLRRSLDKNPKRRWQAAGDLRAELETVALTPSVEVAAIGRARRSAWRSAPALAGTAVVAAALAGAAGFYARPGPQAQPVVRFPITLADGLEFTSFGSQMFAVSPDGTRVAFIADRRLFVRALSEADSRPIPGAGGGAGIMGVAFSPDGDSLAYWSATDRTLKRIPTTGGSPTTITPLDDISEGISWDASGILFGLESRGVMRVSPEGGDPEELIALDKTQLAHGPQMLPGGKAVLFTLVSGAAADRWDKASIVVQTLATRERRQLMVGGDARYLPSGHIVYAEGGTIFAIPFDLSSLQVRGTAKPVVDGVRRERAATGEAFFEVSDGGVMVYMRASSQARLGLDLALTDRHGALTPLMLSPAGYDTPRVSPDGKFVAVGIDDGKTANVWVQDLARARAMRRLTVGGNNRFPVWSPDSRRLAFQSDRDGDAAIFRQEVDGTGTERLTTPDRGTSHTPESWSGESLLFTAATGAGTGNSLRLLSLTSGQHQPFGGVESAYPIGSAFSPDGKSVAYAIFEPPSMTVYVQPFPATNAVHQISRDDDGHHPVWSRDGKELFYVAGPGQFAVAGITTTPAFTLTGPVRIHPGLNSTPPSGERDFDVTPDGRLLGIVSQEDRQTYVNDRRQLQVVLNWTEELKRLVPTR